MNYFYTLKLLNYTLKIYFTVNYHKEQLNVNQRSKTRTKRFIKGVIPA